MNRSEHRRFFQRYQYELLLVALVQHLFIGLVLTDMDLYARVVWPINMILVGAGSVGVFQEKGKWERRLRNVLFVLVLVLPLSLPFQSDTRGAMLWISVVYTVFFSFIFVEVMRYLVRPGRIDRDIISAAVCGMLLLIEIAAFGLQGMFYQDAATLRGVAAADPASIYMDLVYFATITIATIGYGDIAPGTHQAKLAVSLIGIAGQLYMVVLMGILISKFTNRRTQGPR